MICTETLVGQSLVNFPAVFLSYFSQIQYKRSKFAKQVGWVGQLTNQSSKSQIYRTLLCYKVVFYLDFYLQGWPNSTNNFFLLQILCTSQHLEGGDSARLIFVLVGNCQSVNIRFRSVVPHSSVVSHSCEICNSDIAIGCIDIAICYLGLHMLSQFDMQWCDRLT